MSELSFAAMTADDLDWVAASEAELHAHPWSRGSFADALASGYEAWIMHRAGEPIGYSIVLNVLDESHLLDIGVVAAVQGQGFGRHFLDWLCERARQRGSDSFFLEVRPSNIAALRLYERFGFTEIGRRRGYYPAAEGREDAIVMRLAL